MEPSKLSTAQETAQAFADASGIEYRAEFVPQSRSRNAKEKSPSLNWRVTLTKNGHSIETDYMQGCAHIPHYSHQFSRLAVYDDAVRRACECGKSELRPGQKNGYDAAGAGSVFARTKPIPAPTLVEVLYSLVMDSDAIDYPRFEEWADNIGYDRDSRSAEKIYRACLEIGLALRGMIDLDKAREAFQDY
jgi:hypothetical protein